MTKSFIHDLHSGNRSGWRAFLLRFILLPVFLFSLSPVQAALPETVPNPSEQEVQPAGDLDSIEANIDRVLASLSSIVLREKISRFAGVAGIVRRLDSFEAEVSIADGVERYTNVRGRDRTYQHVSEIGGLWSFGELVTMLRTSRDIIDSSAPKREFAPLQTVFRFQGSAADHKWFVTMTGQIYWLDFEGTICLSDRTGEIERLTWTSSSGPSGTGIASILWEVDFGVAAIAGELRTIPLDSVYRVVRTGRTRKAEWNRTEYVALGRYGSIVDVRYAR